MTVCPKCHKPLEEEGEVYICCGTAPVEWRCSGCQKVSEGFAFPYGGCPACGAALELIDPQLIDDAGAMEGLRRAFEIELGGHAFYSRAAVTAADPDMRTLFERLAAMETEHMAVLARRYHADVPAPSADFQVERAAIFAGIDHRPGDPDNLFRIAVACEEKAVAYFAGQGEAAPAGSAEQQLYRELAAEEREHIDLLATAWDRWKAGAAVLI